MPRFYFLEYDFDVRANRDLPRGHAGKMGEKFYFGVRRQLDHRGIEGLILSKRSDAGIVLHAIAVDSPPALDSLPLQMILGTACRASRS